MIGVCEKMRDRYFHTRCAPTCLLPIHAQQIIVLLQRVIVLVQQLELEGELLRLLAGGLGLVGAPLQCGLNVRERFRGGSKEMRGRERMR